jgi:hypothetical protein
MPGRPASSRGRTPKRSSRPPNGMSTISTAHITASITTTGARGRSHFGTWSSAPPRGDCGDGVVELGRDAIGPVFQAWGHGRRLA